MISKMNFVYVEKPWRFFHRKNTGTAEELQSVVSELFA